MNAAVGRSGAIFASAAMVLGCAVLALRPPATFGAFAVTGAVGVVGALIPLRIRQDERASPGRWLAVVAMGIAAFAVVRMSVATPTPFLLPALAANVVAGVAEEGFFRRLVYGVFARWGAGVAVVGAAAAFAVIHVPVYGIEVLPIDLAAGLLLGWQRWATGGWSAPAVTHVTANLIQMW